MGFIYCYTNKITGKKYIGQTINPDQRKACHKNKALKEKSDYYFHRSIRKHGWDNFDYQVLEETDNLNERETHYIKEMNTLWPHGYNELLEHNGMPESVRQKISKTKKEQWNLLSEEEKKSRIDRMTESNRGKKRSEETRKKQSESAKKYLAKNPRKTKVWTQEMKDNMSKLLKEKYSQGIGRWAK